MKKGRVSKQILVMLLAAVICLGGFREVLAETAKSENYQITETEFGTSTNQETCSGEYCAQATIGDLSGKQSSSSYSAFFEPITEDSEPLLEVIIEDGASNLGVLSTERTATKTTTIKVRNYLSDGYLLYINGDPPRYRDHFLASPSEPTSSQPGTEQFAVNAVANSEPTIGSDPRQVPSSELSFGQVEPNYASSNLFMYRSGDVLARSTQESGQTDYTVSMIINVANSTPSGHYAADFSAIVVPVF